MLTSAGFVVASATGASAAAVADPGDYVPKWAPFTQYAGGRQVISPNNDVVSAKVAHRSSASYATDTAKWTLSPTFARYQNLARHPDCIITGVVTRDENGAATSAPVVWPDGSPGTYTATTVSPTFLGAVDAYTITYGAPVTRTYTQPAITRDAGGAATNVPAITAV